MVATSPHAHRSRPVLDLVFLVGVVGKGIDGLLELIGGVLLLVTTPAQLQHLARLLTAGELREDPDDAIARALLHSLAHLDTGTTTFLAAYVLLHGVVKVAIVAALLLGSRRVYPWAIGVLGVFLVYQVYALVVGPTRGMALLTVLDLAIILLTWREWRHGRTLHETWRSTLAAFRPRRGTDATSSLRGGSGS